MAASESLFLHVCCAPCFATARASMADARFRNGPRVGGIIFYNPNIHPLLEFRRRVKALRLYLERDHVSAEIDDNYGLRAFLAHMVQDGKMPTDRRERCRRCYLLRLGQAARRAAATGYPVFSTTLLASREQDRDLVAAAGHEAGREAGVRFYEADLRAVLPEEKMLRGIYRQQYCGCIFSEEERFLPTGKHLYPPRVVRGE